MASSPPLEAYHNIPDKYLRQHSDFSIGGEEYNKPVAQVRYPTYADLLVEMEILEHDQQRIIMMYGMLRDVGLDYIGMRTMKYDALSALDGTEGEAGSHGHYADSRAPRDIYHELLRALSRAQVKTLDMLLSKPPMIKREEKHVYKTMFFAQYGSIEQAIIKAEGVLYLD